MKRFSIFIVCTSITLLLIGSVFCDYVNGVALAPWADPDKAIFSVNGQIVSGEEFTSSIIQKAYAGESDEVKAARANGTLPAAPTGYVDAPASAPATTETAPVVTDTAVAPAPTEAAPATNEAAAPEPAKGKAEVTFTDENGGYLGSSKVTIGTDVASSQFVQDVPDCNGHKFDHWDYDGHVIEHDYIIRAIYK